MEHEDMQCGACMATPPRHDGVLAATAYCKVSSAVVMRYKYGKRPGLSRILAQGMERHLMNADHVNANNVNAENIILVPVPLHRWRLWQRGFNQSALVAKRLSKRLALPVIVDGLIRHRNTPPLRGLNPRQRRDTVQSAFSVNAKHADYFKGRDIVLVDDVYTTGATANACAQVLKRGGAGRVQILCWARALPGRDLDV
jgi:ComF family protein